MTATAIIISTIIACATYCTVYAIKKIEKNEEDKRR